MTLNWRKVVGLSEWRTCLIMIAVALLPIILIRIVDERWWQARYLVMWILFGSLPIVSSILIKGSPKFTNRIRERSEIFGSISVVAISSSFISSSILLSLTTLSDVSNLLFYLLLNIWMGLYILGALVVLALIPKKRKPSTDWPSARDVISVSLALVGSALVLSLVITGTEMLRLVSSGGVQ